MGLTLEQSELAVNTLQKMFTLLGIPGSVEDISTEADAVLAVKTEESGRVIGRKRQALESMQLLLNRLIHKAPNDFSFVAIDVDGYRSQPRRSGGRDDRRSRDDGAAAVSPELEKRALDLAKDNIALNDLGDRVKVQQADISQPFARLALSPFDAALANPPFFDDPGALRAPKPEKHAAWMAKGGLEAWTTFLLKSVREGGRITLIHRADRLADLLALLSPKAGSFQIRPIHPFADAPAKRVLVRTLKTGKAPLQLLPPVILHARDGGKHTPRADALLRGEAELGWV